MFVKTDTNHQMDLFADAIPYTNKRTIRALERENKWFNVFFREITAKIDEEPLRALFEEGNMGAPNASIRALIAINVLKDGVGISDEQLFDATNCDLRYRKAIGMSSFSDTTPSQEVYYMFRRRLYKYEVETGINLMYDSFHNNAKHLICTRNISGKSIRMDSKLIGSNIVWFSRYELVQKIFVKHVSPLVESLNPSLKKQAKAIIERDSQKDLYTLNKADVQTLFAQMGVVLRKILVKLHIPGDHILRRLFNEQYTCEEGQAQPKDNKYISANSIQSPYDTDAAYRKKGDQKVKGYTTNITETVPEDGEVSVITNVAVKPGTTADNDFVEKAVSNTESITGNKIETIFADGAYQSESNREFAEENNIKIYACGLQGKEGKNDYALQENGDVIFTDKRTRKTYIAKICKPKRNCTKRIWVSIDSVGRKRYVTEKALKCSKIRKKIKITPPELMNSRNNVDAAMFQYSFHTRNGKTRYRALFKHELQAYPRCMWMNFRRYLSYINKIMSRNF